MFHKNNGFELRRISKASAGPVLGRNDGVEFIGAIPNKGCGSIERSSVGHPSIVQNGSPAPPHTALDTIAVQIVPVAIGCACVEYR